MCLSPFGKMALSSHFQRRATYLTVATGKVTRYCLYRARCLDGKLSDILSKMYKNSLFSASNSLCLVHGTRESHGHKMVPFIFLRLARYVPNVANLNAKRGMASG